MTRRHKWVPLPAFPDRADLRRCARDGCDMLRRDFGPMRYEYRTGATGGPDGMRALQPPPTPEEKSLCDLIDTCRDACFREFYALAGQPLAAESKKEVET